MPNHKVRVGRARTSLHSDKESNCDDSKEKIVYVHPRRKYVVPTRPKRRKSCINRFCVGICNLFNRLKPTEYEEEHCYALSPICYKPDRGDKTIIPSTRALEANSTLNRGSLVNYGSTYWSNQGLGSEADDDYIIYFPRVSRSKLERKHESMRPLSIHKASYSPIFIHSCSGNLVTKCRAECCSRASNVNVKYSPTRNQTFIKERDPACEGNVSRSHRRRRRIHTSCRASYETITEYIDHHDKTDNRETRAGGDSGDNDKGEKSVGSKTFTKGSKTALLYVPTRSENPDKQHFFKIQEKNINWTALHERHDTAARNRQRILQETKDRLQRYSANWSRRKLIGEKKRVLAKENESIICPAPNMLESRFHHIHWLGNTGNDNNSVGRYFDKEENRVVAIKIFSNKPFPTAVENLDNKLMAIQEINSLKVLHHKNIVQLLGYFELHDKYHLILESCDHSLRGEIQDAPSGLGTSVSKKMIKHILHGLHFCHQTKCLHRDLSPDNILVCKSGLVKLADFDRSVFLNESIGNTCPTPGSYVYNSPEILAGDKEYGLPSDVWSLGIIFCELLTGKPPWNGKSAQSQLREIHNCVGPLLPRHAYVAKLHVDANSYTVHNHAQLQQMFTTISAPCCSFIMKCLDVNPLCRFTCGELLQHQFMKGNYK